MSSGYDNNEKQGRSTAFGRSVGSGDSDGQKAVARCSRIAHNVALFAGADYVVS
jgi:hypothetical protein